MTATPNEPEREVIEEAVAEETVAETEKPRKKLKHKKLITVLAVILALCLTFVATFFIIVKNGEKKLRQSNVVATDSDDFDYEAIYYNGKAYSYNEELINILFIGVDNDTVDSDTMGQADALYLASINNNSGKVNIYAISRNTVCTVDVLDASGEPYGKEEQQICLSYAYGKDAHNASVNTARSVSRLLYNIPISGYYTVYLDSIADIVSAVGGVTVSVSEDFIGSSIEDKVGQRVTLYGNDAITFIRYRGDSNEPRADHQKEFINSFITSAKAAVKKDLGLPVEMVNKLSDEVVTNVSTDSLIYLATEAVNWKSQFYTVAGTYDNSEKYETYTVNEDALQDMLINGFYIAKGDN